MKFNGLAKSRLATLFVLLLLTSVPSALGQERRSAGQPREQTVQPSDTAQKPWVRTIGTGQKAKLKGNIVSRDADTIGIRDEQDREVVVVLTDRTSVKSKGGFLRWGKDYEVTSLMRGLPIEVEGFGNEEGQLVATRVRFDTGDLKTARLVDSRVSPVEEANKRLSGQVDELGEVSKLARNEAGRANDRISSLDDYEVQDSSSVYFRTGSYVISPEDRRALDDIAQKAMSTKGYVIEIAGYADSTGNMERNRVLSQQRADAVVRYLQENHDIPLRRIVTPFGYGQMRPVADNGNADGRRQNRRVEVKLLVSRGMRANS